MRWTAFALVVLASGCATSIAPQPAMTSSLGVADATGNLGDVAGADASDAAADTGTPSLCPSSCDDGNACSVDTCNPATGCIHADSTGPACDDGDACSTGDACQAGKCVGQPVSCDDGKPCTSDSCETAAGCVYVAESVGAPCDDGNPCSTNDNCLTGSCVGDVLKACDDGKTCTIDKCDPGAGNCLHLPLEEGPCDDGDPCTAGDACSAGNCKPGKNACDDGNPCTADVCGASGCSSSPTSGPCDDGNACTFSDVCKAGACSPGLPTGCDDGNVCTADECNKSSGSCVNKANAGPCDDGNPCTAGETCAGGACAAPPAADCADGKPCTIDTCTMAGCAHKPATGVACEDGDNCTIADTCVEGVCIPGPGKTCDDGQPCTADLCDAKSASCSHTAASGISCDDGKACTDGDTCQAGVCLGLKKACDDANPCTNDKCDPESGCVHTNNDFAACTTGSTECPVGQCAGGVCQYKPNITCQTKIKVNACSDNVSVVGVCTGSGKCTPTQAGNGSCTSPCNGICLKCNGTEACVPF